MSKITKEQAKDLRNAFNCWQQDYDPVEDKEQYDMFGLGMVAMDALLASLEAEAVAQVLSSRAGNDTSTIDKALPEGTRLFTAPPAPISVPDENGLLPCPFCGSPAEHYPDGDMEGYSVMCGHKNGDCNSWIFGFATPEEAERSWNTRAAMLHGDKL